MKTIQLLFLVYFGLLIIPLAPASAEQTTAGNIPFIYGSQAPYYARVNRGQAVFVDKHGFCRYVDNTGETDDLFVPFQTAEEWRSFRSNEPDNIGLLLCCAPKAVTYCNETKLIPMVGVIGSTADVNFGYEKTVVFSCSGTNENADANGVWSVANESGQCEQPYESGGSSEGEGPEGNSSESEGSSSSGGSCSAGDDNTGDNDCGNW